jgi:hypothetical protein
MHQARFFVLFAVAAGGAAIAWPGAVRELMHLSPTSPPVPGIDGDPVEIDPSVVAGSGDPGCLQVGGTTQTFSRASAIRGNVFSITKTVTVTEIVMQLTVPTPTPLHVAVYSRASGTTANWIRYPDPMGNDILIEDPAVGPLAFQTTGPLETPLVLQAGSDYLIGFAWGAVNVSFPRDSATYPGATPPDVNFGDVLGLFGLNNITFQEGQLPDQFANGVIDVFNLGAHSMQLCVAGACCTGGTITPQCRELSRTGCQRLFGQYTSEGITCADVAKDGDLCPLDRGACCESPTVCNYINKWACEARGGDWHRLILCGNTEVQPCALRGACCLENGSCAEALTEQQCDADDGVWLGVDGAGDPIACEDANPGCEAGACCQPGEPSGCFVMSRDKCVKGGGLFVGNGLSCDDEPCIPRGACCNPASGVCTEDLTQAQCQSVAGRVYRGDGTICSDLRPVCGRGACCTATTGCEDGNGAGLTQAACQSLTGTYRGDGTTCLSLDPQCPGLCCRGIGFTTCNASVQPGVCSIETGGVFLGYGGSCSPNPCSGIVQGSIGACCLSSGDCIEVYDRPGVTAEQLCDQLQGVFTDATRCPAACVATGACCDREAGECVPGQTEAACSGEWAQGVDCPSFNPRCELTGACCNRTQLTCVNDVPESQCAAPLQWTANIRCADLDEPCAPTGACCLPGAEGCQEGMTQAQCAGSDGTYLGDDEVCEPESCIPKAACCEGTTCSVRTEAACDAADGIWLENESVCVDDTCDPKGACCNGSACTQQTQAACAPPARYLGDDVPCVPESCVPRGACCVTVLGCQDDVTQADCDGDSGTYAGDGTTCIPNLCDAGACCPVDCTACTDVPDGATCLSDGGLFTPGATCAAVACGQHIVSSDPANCAIDARQPHTPESATPPAGPTSLMLTFACTATGTNSSDFEIFGVPPPGVTISNVMVNGTMATLTFSGPIPPGQYTCVRHIDTGDEVCIGYLPGDVNSDGVAMTDAVDPADDDVQVLTAYFKTGVPNLEIWQCDIDRSTVCTALDIAREIDVLVGADAFDPWVDVDIGGCPSGPGACCDGQVCSLLEENACESAGGEFRGSGTDCDSDPLVCAPRGACCIEGECNQEPEETCLLLGGTYSGDGVACEADTCLPHGACCVGNTCSSETEANCDGAYAGDGTVCDADTCLTGACCDSQCFCENGLFGYECDADGGVFHAGAICQASTCALDIASSIPPHCGIDARQYQNPELGLEPTFGVGSILLTMTCDASDAVNEDFVVTAVGGQAGLALDHIDPPVGSTVNVVFNKLLQHSLYACTEYVPTGETACIGFLPGDVDASRKSEGQDTVVLIQHLDGDLAEPLGLWQCDADRSGECTALDVLRHIDILVGTNETTPWKDAQINPCP